MKCHPAAYRILHLPLHPGRMVHKRQPSRWLPCWPWTSLIITVLKLYTAEIVPNVEGHPNTSPSLHIPSEELTTIHCTTPATTITPPRLCHGDYIMVIMVSHSTTVPPGFLPILCALVQMHFSSAIDFTFWVVSCDTWLQAACIACNVQLIMWIPESFSRAAS